MDSAAFTTPLIALLVIQGMLIFFLAWRAQSDRQRVSPRINRRALVAMMVLGLANIALFAALLAARLIPPPI